ncbi:hypothetical protein XELAEV_18032315mg [Xenopus laevis]|uniref:Uncharacterized protein n=1 Tax=Xenopus laevis TaxID=8355 RepID=A0A974HGH9_XENLA|nr:hypothetical protein XELAEV_18032315mg [Xenopus laevis]
MCVWLYISRHPHIDPGGNLKCDAGEPREKPLFFGGGGMQRYQLSLCEWTAPAAAVALCYQTFFLCEKPLLSH